MSLAWQHPASFSKSRMLEGSLRCFTLGCVGLIPLLGLPAALLAMLEYRSVILRKEYPWNAARVYLIWGGTLGGIGLLISLLSVGGLILALFHFLSKAG